MSDTTLAATHIRTSTRGLSYSRRGSGAPVVLVHGWCLNREMWLYLEHDLVTAGFDTIAVDLAGHGRSGDLTGPFSLQRHHEDLVALLAELGLRQVTAVGFALGAAVLLSGADHSRFSGYICIGIPDAGGAPYAKMQAAMLRDWPLFAMRSARAICGAEHSRETLDWLGHMFMRTRLAVAVSGAEVLGAFEPRNLTQTWTVPCLFVHGSQDTIASVEVSRGCANTLEASRLLIIDDSGHLVPLDQPAKLRDAVIEFAGDPAAGNG